MFLNEDKIKENNKLKNIWEKWPDFYDL